MNPKLSDDAVAGLPLSAARAELLEEIMATPTLDRLDPDSPAVRSPRRWTTILVAAAAVLAVVGVPAYVLNRDEPQVAVPAAPTGELDLDPATAFRAVLDAPGWTVEHMYEDEHGGEVTFAKADQSLDIHWRGAEHYASYLEDREHIDHPKVDKGAPIELLGQPARMWHYSASDHTAIAEASGRHFFEVRGSRMGEATYLDLLAQLRRVDVAGFAEAMPEDVVSMEDSTRVVQAMLADIPVPEGFELDASRLPEFSSRYHVGARLTEAVTCAWIEVYAVGQAGRDQAAVDRATDAMGGSKDWDILTEMQKTGDWAPTISEVGDGMAQGVPGDEIVNWVDCDSDGMSGQNL